MAKTNLNIKHAHADLQTHEGGRAKYISPEQELRRSVLACLLYEKEFYESGIAIADRIGQLCFAVKPEIIASLALEARSKYHLRHVPLLLLNALTTVARGAMVGDTIAATIQRADELSEFLAIYWAKGKHPLSAQTKKGLAKAFTKFSKYNLAKYNRDSMVKLRDVLFLSHAKPKDETQAEVFKRLVNKDLPAPDTWEVELSAGKDKKATFERLIVEGKLGYLALLRNLRGMVEVNVDLNLISEAILARKGADRVLPFRYIAAARACPQLEPQLDVALCAAIGELSKLAGSTVVLVDVSGSMSAPLSRKSDMTRADAACALASIINTENLRVFSFSDHLVEVAPRRGMAGVDAIQMSQEHRSTYLGAAVNQINEMIPSLDRLIVISDEQAHDNVPDSKARLSYMINVASAQRGVGYGKWVHVDGFSENVLRYIHETEALDRTR